jgi:hypothetical protein
MGGGVIIIFYRRLLISPQSGKLSFYSSFICYPSHWYVTFEYGRPIGSVLHDKVIQTAYSSICDNPQENTYNRHKYFLLSS